jgi:CheY-like chemotaxis protein
MGGDLTVDAHTGRGTTFRVRLPVTDAAVAPPSRPTPKKGARRRLVALDDEPLIGTMIQRILSDDHDVEATTSSDEVIARVAAGERFDLILCDLMMPGRSGIDVQREISRASSEQAQRMVFLTGGSMAATVEATVSRNGNVVVSKPFSVEELRGSIDKALARVEPWSKGT